MPEARPHHSGSQAAEAFVAALADPKRAPIAARDCAVVVAHPDDETIGCGAQLRRLKGATVVVVTDGAPRDPGEVRARGFADVEGYAAARAGELRRALAFASIEERNIAALGLPDQTAALRLVELTRTILRLISERGIRVVLTHAYEGGHPDHDATSFAVHAAASLQSREAPLAVVEMPYYRAGDAGWLLQSFLPVRDRPARTIMLNPFERRCKQRMIAAHATQQPMLRYFGIGAEHFRAAPNCHFGALPNRGQLFYERHDWGMTGQRWLALARAAIGDLRLEQKRCA